MNDDQALPGFPTACQNTDSERPQLRFEIKEHSIRGFFDDPSRPAELEMTLDCLMGLEAPDALQLLEATERYLAPKKYATQLALARNGIVKFGYYLADRQVTKLPTSTDDWQFLILDLFGWYLLHNHETSATRIRTKSWEAGTALWLRALIDEELIPEGLVIPRARKRSRVGKRRSPITPDLLGEKPAEYTNQALNRTIAGPLFWRSDVEYLDEVESILRKRDHVLRTVTDDYFLRLVKDYQSGKRLMARISDQEFDRRKTLVDWTSHVAGKFNYRETQVTRPYMPNSAGWALRILRDILHESSNEFVFSRAELSKHPGLTNSFMAQKRFTPIEPLNLATALEPHQLAMTESRVLFMRFLGILTPLDVVVASVILTQEHPNLTPTAITGARLISPSGKSFLLATGEGSQTLFSVDKPRAGTRKYASLTPRAERLIKHLIRATRDVRELMRRAGHSHWRYLFLGCPAGPSSRVGLLPPPAKKLVADGNHKTLARFYPQIEDAGLVKGVLNLKKIRNTQGVLDWFDSGSIKSASRKLGNKYTTALRHYIPEPLIRLWNERIIRRFQNTLIALAAYDEDYLLDVTDIETFGDLQDFLMQLLAENPMGSSPIGDELHKRIAGSRLIPDGVDSISSNDEVYSMLSVRLGPEALALLYAYRSIALNSLNPKMLALVDSSTGISPNSLIQMANLFRSAARDGDVSDVMRESLDLARLKDIDNVAMRRLPGLLNRLTKIRVEPKWECDT